jgi:hypothetical protein
MSIDIENGVITDKKTDINLQAFIDTNIRLTSPWEKPIPGMPGRLSINPEPLRKMILDPPHQPNTGNPPFIANPESPLGKSTRYATENSFVELSSFREWKIRG